MKFPEVPGMEAFVDVYQSIAGVLKIAVTTLNFYSGRSENVDKSHIASFVEKSVSLFKRFEGALLKIGFPSVCELFKQTLWTYEKGSVPIEGVESLILKLNSWSGPTQHSLHYGYYSNLDASLLKSMELYVSTPEAFTTPHNIQFPNGKKDLCIAFLKFVEKMWPKTFPSNEELQYLRSTTVVTVIEEVLYCLSELGKMGLVESPMDFIEKLQLSAVSFRSDCGWCSICSKSTNNKCGKCKFTRYCSADCQKKGWLHHKTHCETVDINDLKSSMIAKPPWPHVTIENETLTKIEFV
jgi:hypothetical protein